MRRILLIFIVPLLALAIVFTTGFSIWYFGTQSSESHGNVNVGVENSTGIGDLDVTPPNCTLYMGPASKFNGVDGINFINPISSINEQKVNTNITATYHNNSNNIEQQRIKFSAVVVLPITAVPFLEVNIHYVDKFKQHNSTANAYYEYVTYIEPNTLNPGDTRTLTVPTDLFNWTGFLPNSDGSYNILIGSLKDAKVRVDFKVEYVA